MIKDYIEHIRQSAGTLPVGLVAAIIEVESGWDTYAMRYEPVFAARYITRELVQPRGVCTRLTEELSLAMSWGLMQIMGQTARELGFDRPYLAALCDPAPGIEYGCRLLRQKWQRYAKEYGVGGVISAYNAGKPRTNDRGQWVNQDYVDKVKSAWDKYAKLS